MVKEEHEKTEASICGLDDPDDCVPCRIAIGGVYAIQICRKFKETNIDCDKALKEMQEGVVSPLSFIARLKTEAKTQGRKDIVSNLNQLEELIHNKNK